MTEEEDRKSSPYVWTTDVNQVPSQKRAEPLLIGKEMHTGMIAIKRTQSTLTHTAVIINTIWILPGTRRKRQVIDVDTCRDEDQEGDEGHVGSDKEHIERGTDQEGDVISSVDSKPDGKSATGLFRTFDVLTVMELVLLRLVRRRFRCTEILEAAYLQNVALCGLFGSKVASNNPVKDPNLHGIHAHTY